MRYALFVCADESEELTEEEVQERWKAFMRFQEDMEARGALVSLQRLQPTSPATRHAASFPAPGGGPLNLDNFRKREWAPAVEASGVRIPATPYDMRDTFASNALAAGVTVFELARVMGTSVRMIEKHYGALLDGAHAGIAGRLDAFDAAAATSESETSTH
jgi:integrase